MNSHMQSLKPTTTTKWSPLTNSLCITCDTYTTNKPLNLPFHTKSPLEIALHFPQPVWMWQLSYPCNACSGPRCWSLQYNIRTSTTTCMQYGRVVEFEDYSNMYFECIIMFEVPYHWTFNKGKAYMHFIDASNMKLSNTALRMQWRVWNMQSIIFDFYTEMPHTFLNSV